MTNQSKQNVRSLALDSLLAIERDGKYSNLEVGVRLDRSDLSAADRALYTRLVYGVTERRITLDYVIGQNASRSPETLDPVVRQALRLGLYQLIYMDKIPAHAAVDESVRLVPRTASGFVNAVLRTFLRKDKTVVWPPEDDSAFYLSVKESVPIPLAAHFIGLYGRDEAAELLEAMNREPAVCLRVNTLRMTADEAAEKTGGVKSSWADDIVRISSFDETVRKGLENGDWFVQDEASRAATLAVAAEPGDTVADTCACPGGKTFSLALDMKNTGRIHACDLHRNKLSLIVKGAEKLGIGIIDTAERDARQPAEEWAGLCDRVLCDAPCSGLGVLAKKPEIRYKDLKELERLPQIQKAIIAGASAYVKHGGVLVYSTCTVNPAENEEVVSDFLASHEDFRLEPDEKLLPEGMRTFLPHRDGCDGFFTARMIRK